MAIEKIKRKKGHVYRATIRDARRKKVSKTFDRKIDAQKWEREQLQRRENPQQVEDITFDALIDKWKTLHVSGLAVGTQQRYDQHIRIYYLPFFGGQDLKDIRVADIDDWYQWMQTTRLSASTVASMLGRLEGIFEWARKRRYIEANPVSPVDPIKPPENADKDYEIWTASEVEMFLAWCKREDEPLYQIALAALNTGARLGELIGLQWDKVDMQRRLIHISRKWNNKSGELESTTKGRRSRTIAINDALYGVLAEQKLGGKRPWVFCEADGSRIKSNQLTCYRFRPACEKAGVRAIRFHDLRHTFAVHFMQAGGDIYKLQRQLGHKSIETTQQYLRFSPQFAEGLHQSAEMVAFGGSKRGKADVILIAGQNAKARGQK
jgi:integrase